MPNYNITLGNGQKFHGRGWFLEDAIKRELGDIDIRILYPIRARIIPTEPITKDGAGSE